MKIALLSLLVLPLLLIGGCKDDKMAANPGQGALLSVVTASGQQQNFTVEIALTPQEMARGLMNRTEMAKDAGMIFWFGDEAERGFWMKNTYIPLDLIFIRRDGTIGHIHENAKPMDETSIRSNGPAAAVLEINGGLSKTLGIAPGDKVHHLFFGNSLAP
jgi:uncharacterized membrane protein (UPF0127 family)